MFAAIGVFFLLFVSRGEFLLAKVNSSEHIHLNVIVDNFQGNFSVVINNQTWFSSGDVFVQSSGRIFTTSDGSLQLQSFQKFRGSDKIGNHTKFEMVYATASEDILVCSIRQYNKVVVFKQTFTRELTNTSTSNADGLVTGFPTFVVDDSHGGEGYAHWLSWFYSTDGVAPSQPAERVSRRALVAPGFASPQLREWNSGLNMSGGIGGTGVLSVFDGAGTAVVLSALSSPMVVSHVCPAPGRLSYGIMGNVTTVPAGFSTEVVLTASSGGVNAAMGEWGEVVRSYHGKANATVARQRDVTLRFLGYTTDNGAYYYYHTEADSDYEQTLVAVKEYADALQIPYRYVLLDSWWYYKGSNGGVANWTALPEVFPNGVEALYNRTGWLVQAHNRYWALDNHYSRSNGGRFEFVEDPVKGGAAPVGEEFWESLLSGPARQWGLAVYEQDWLFNEFFEYVSQMLESVDLGRNWLLEMGRGAEKAGVTVQYCMPFVRHLLQSLEVPAATQARASDDYVVSPYVGVDNWRIGGQTLLIDALGMAPSKDGYWSGPHQAGNPYGEDRFEPYPRLHAAVAAISAGPVAIADGIGFSDAPLIMRSCSKNGRLLQPSSPAAMIDAQILQSALGGDVGPQGEVWFAPSIVHGRKFGSIFVADLQLSWEMRPSDAGYHRDGPALLVYESNATSVVFRWSAAQPLRLKTCGLSDFALWTVAPVERNGWALLGETDKWVGVAPARFERIVATAAESLSTLATGADGEWLTVGFASPALEVVTVRCRLGRSGKVLISSTGTCSDVRA